MNIFYVEDHRLDNNGSVFWKQLPKLQAIASHSLASFYSIMSQEEKFLLMTRFYKDNAIFPLKHHAVFHFL